MFRYLQPLDRHSLEMNQSVFFVLIPSGPCFSRPSGSLDAKKTASTPITSAIMIPTIRNVLVINHYETTPIDELTKSGLALARRGR